MVFVNFCQVPYIKLVAHIRHCSMFVACTYHIASLTSDIAYYTCTLWKFTILECSRYWQIDLLGPMRKTFREILQNHNLCDFPAIFAKKITVCPTICKTVGILPCFFLFNRLHLNRLFSALNLTGRTHSTPQIL